jgi:hypothetical protein
VFRLQQLQTAGPSDEWCTCDLVSLSFTRLRPDPDPRGGRHPRRKKRLSSPVPHHASCREAETQFFRRVTGAASLSD